MTLNAFGQRRERGGNVTAVDPRSDRPTAADHVTARVTHT